MRVVNLIRVPVRVERCLVTMPVTMRTPITPTFRHHAEPTGRASLAPFCVTALRDQTGPVLPLWATRFSRQSEPTSARLKVFAAFCVRTPCLRFAPLGSVVRLVLLRTARPSFMWPNFPQYFAPVMSLSPRSPRPGSNFFGACVGKSVRPLPPRAVPRFPPRYAWKTLAHRPCSGPG